MLKLVLLQLTVGDSQLMIVGHFPRASAPTEDQGGFAQYSRYTSCDATDGSSNPNYLKHDSMESPTLRKLRGLSAAAMYWYKYDYRDDYRHDYWYHGLATGTVQDSGAAIADHGAAP